MNSLSGPKNAEGHGDAVPHVFKCQIRRKTKENLKNKIGACEKELWQPLEVMFKD